MSNINDRKLALLKWLNIKNSNYSNLQTQKFLFFYEMFQFINNKDYDITNLKAYKNGPVFSDVYGFQRYEKDFLESTVNANNDTSYNVDKENVEKALFLTSTMTDTELSDLTHQLDMWKSKKKLIDDGKKQIPIELSDISSEDKEKLKKIYKTALLIDNFKIIKIANKIFLIKKEELNDLTDEHYEVLDLLSQENDLINPVYLSIDGEGVLLVD
ncbi:hypothetical protein LDK09_09400 [Fusobacterium animalis]|jgi:hypothetical protein|uniref:Antitoxin SocA-like Panacea domain-containing protein n=1 Tax=Fusobacterium animalis F0419 TaxID=999414 RepID=H1HFU2_9FUSO|nr:hypothetical protein [Fusobacterium animalis]EHO77615.1 hypothetical protein HMPREF9942_01343 [Fusobacterium animalis F0419]